MKEERNCLKCSKPLPKDPKRFRGPRRKYHKECSINAYKERDRRNKAEKRRIQQRDELLKRFDPKTLKALTKYLAQSLRNSIYCSLVEKPSRYKSDYREVQELVDLIDEMIWAHMSKNEPTIRNIVRDEINTRFKKKIKKIKSP